MNAGLGYGLMSVGIACWTERDEMNMKAGLGHGLMSVVIACRTKGVG